MLPDDRKDIANLYTFKNKIKKWKDENCPCRLRKTYINNPANISTSDQRYFNVVDQR